MTEEVILLFIKFRGGPIDGKMGLIPETKKVIVSYRNPSGVFEQYIYEPTNEHTEEGARIWA